MPDYFVVISKAGPRRDLERGTREQPLWDEHASFIDGLVDSGHIVLGGPLVDEAGAMLVVRANHEREVRDMLAADPWYAHGILQLESIRRWEIYIDQTRG